MSDLKNIKPYDSFNESSIWSGIDLQKEFDMINQEAFDGELGHVELKLVHTKDSGGRLYSTGKRTQRYGHRYGPLYDETPRYIAISTYYDKSYEEFRNTLAHEMIHLWILQNKVADNNYHGFRFQDKMKEVNGRGFNVTLKDDVGNVEVTDRTPIKEVGVVVLDDRTEGKVLVSVMDLSQVTEANMKDILETVRYTSKVNKKKYQLSFRSSTYYRLGTYKMTKKYKSAHKLKYYNMGDLADLMENSKLVDGWNIDAGNLEHFRQADV